MKKPGPKPLKFPKPKRGGNPKATPAMSLKLMPLDARPDTEQKIVPFPRGKSIGDSKPRRKR